MHVLIPFASTLAEGCRHTVHDLQLPNLSRLLARLSPTLRDSGDADSLSTPQERALAALLGLQGTDGCLPWAAQQAAADGVDVADAAWGLVTPAHWQLASDHVVLADPAALGLDDAGSRALLRSVRDLFEGAGWRIEYGAPLRWYVSHGSLRDLPCASIERAIGRDVDRWMQAEARVAGLRRLQSEVQMLLYDEPLNAEREARGALPVNSFWLSGCGVLQAQIAVPELRVDAALRESAFAEDWAAWADAWRALDSGVLRELLQRAEDGAAATLTLCGERHAQRLEAVPLPLWSRLTRGLRAPAVAPLLEAL